LHPPGTPNPSKNAFLLQQNWFLDGFSVPGGCKSILNVVSINPIWRNFLDRGFFLFRWVKKKVLSVLFGHFCPDLKNIFNIFTLSFPQNWFTSSNFLLGFILRINLPAAICYTSEKI